MDVKDATSDYIRFLSQRGCISHVVSAPAGGNVSTLALTQRCLASGIDFPVPLPDGSVGVCVEGEIPAALAALDLVIEKVLELDAVSALDEPDAAAAVADDSEDMPEPDLDPVDQDGDVEEDLAEAEPHAADDAASDEGTEDGGGLGTSDAVDDELVSEVPVFQRAAADSPMDETTRDPEADESSDVGSPSAELGLGEEESSGDGAVPESSEAETASDARAEPRLDETAIERLLNGLTEIEDWMSTVSATVSALSERMDAFSGALEEVASRPLPRPDAAEFNRGMARMTAAFAQTLRRIEDTVDDLATTANQGGNEVAASLSTGLSGLADAVRLSQAGSGGASSELAVIASMQETLSHQLAKLIEASQVAKAPAMEEFLLDLRHATAELLAEQARLSKTG